MIKYNSKTGPEERNILSYLSLEKTAFAKRNRLISVLCIAVGIVSLFLSIKSLIHFGFNISDTIMLIIALIVIYIGVDGAKRLQKLYFKDEIKVSDDNSIYESTFMINNEGISIINSDTQISKKWNDFKKWNEYEHYIYLVDKKDEITLINKNDLSKEDLKELMTYVKLHVK